jgi:hypothetical protein
MVTGTGAVEKQTVLLAGILPALERQSRRLCCKVSPSFTKKDYALLAILPTDASALQFSLLLVK